MGQIVRDGPAVTSQSFITPVLNIRIKF